jgi:hypothetical protein
MVFNSVTLSNIKIKSGMKYFFLIDSFMSQFFRLVIAFNYYGQMIKNEVTIKQNHSQ